MTNLSEARHAIANVRIKGPGHIVEALEALADAVEDLQKPAKPKPVAAKKPAAKK